MKIKIALVTAGLLFSLCTVATYGAVIQGKLLDPKGTPLPNLSVKIEAIETKPIETVSATYLEERPFDVNPAMQTKPIETKPVETVSAADGTFKFDNLTMKNWKISINDDKWESINLEIRVLSDTETIDHNLVAWQKLQLSGDLLSSYQKAIERYSAKAYDEAIVEVDKLFQAGQSFYIIYALKGSMLFEQQKYTDAIPLLKMALELNPYEVTCNQVLGNYAIDNKKYPESLIYFEKILFSTPTDPDLLEQIANSYYFMENWEKAIEYYKNAIKYYGTSANAAQSHYFMGVSSLKLKHYEEALACFESFLKAAPTSPDAPKTKQLVELLKKKIETDKQKSDNTPK
jgi:tetratricopeptide (TPR) repeat protein